MVEANPRVRVVRVYFYRITTSLTCGSKSSSEWSDYPFNPLNGL